MRYPIKKQRYCEKCKTKFTPNSPTQKYCGSTEYKSGCSWERFNERKRAKDLKWHRKRVQKIAKLEKAVLLIADFMGDVMHDQYTIYDQVIRILE